ncbi:hypothetical protein TSMEX_011568 [Taenia solium]|eukprot:TsM_000332200 transcript=TsM_000332200 gene=TsM_000332200
MSRDRVNPITYLVRRLSKTLSLNRGSITNTDFENLAEYVHHPHVRLPSATHQRTSRSVERSRKGGVPVRSVSACPAPLATADCFDITDVSDAEVGSKDQLSDSKVEAESESGSVTPISYSDSEETQSVDKSEEEPVFTYSGAPTDQIYDFSYPEVLQDESESSLSSTIHKSDSSSSSNSIDVSSSKESSSEGEVEKDELEEGEVSEFQSTETCKGDDNEEQPYREVYQDNYEYYNYPQFEVQHDPQQDPFHEATLIAERQKQFSPPNQLYMNTSPPAILVTSPSNHDITQKSPSRPPPPVTKPVPPPVPPPPKEAQHHPSEPTRPPPPRPSSRPESSTSEVLASPARKKKHKIFGISIGKHNQTDTLSVCRIFLDQQLVQFDSKNK